MKLLIILMFLFSYQVLGKSAKKTLTINCGFAKPRSILITKTLEAIFKEANLGLKIRYLPMKRSLIISDNGIGDGDAARIWDINKYFKNLHRIPIAIFNMNVIALSKENFSIETFKDLKNYNTGVIRGMNIIEVNLEQLKVKSLLKVTSNRDLISLLKKNRIDIAVSDKLSLNQFINECKKNKYIFQEKSVMNIPLYLHLHAKNKYLIPQLTQAIKRLQKKGVLQKIKETFFDKSLFTSDGFQ